MKGALLITSSLILGTTVSALPDQSRFSYRDIVHDTRSTPASPEGYAPSEVECPAQRPVIRVGKGISKAESDWTAIRQKQIAEPMKKFIGRAKIPDFDSDGFLNGLTQAGKSLPNIAIAHAGGSYRAALITLGVIAAFDDREEGTTEPGGLGGLLQSSMRMSALSGATWPLGSVYVNNFTKVSDLMNAGDDKKKDVWRLQHSLLDSPHGPLSFIGYMINIARTVKSKADAGFPVSFTDIWSRMLSYQFIDAPDGGPAYTWSSIASDPWFASGGAPIPYIVAAGRKPGMTNTTLTPLTSTIVEFSPWEMGSFDANMNAFVPLKYLGSAFEAGKLPDNASCIVGFDNAGFIMGASSSLFDRYIAVAQNLKNIPWLLKKLIAKIVRDVDSRFLEVAIISPNPFKLFGGPTNNWRDSERIALVDGGEDGQVIPLYPFLAPDRHTDVIVATDLAADIQVKGYANWPNGSSMVNSYRRALYNAQNPSSQFGKTGTLFPPVPDQNTFVNLGLNNRPTFFGCDAANLTDGTPLIVYLPNSPYNLLSNFSSATLKFSPQQRREMVVNGLNIATQANGTRSLYPPNTFSSSSAAAAPGTFTSPSRPGAAANGPGGVIASGSGTKQNTNAAAADDWHTCVACAVLSRAMHREGREAPGACQRCFERYCWDGRTDSSVPAVYDPEVVLGGGGGGS